MKRTVCIFGLAVSMHAWSFCGFYIAKADSSLYNKASQVILVRNDNKTAITMFNDYQGEMKDFALVVPVPEVLKREQINVGDRALVERVDAFSAPRLVEYFDEDPCQPPIKIMQSRAMVQSGGMQQGGSGASLGVTIEAKYTIGEYDILILSAKESKGLQTWLQEEGYKVPEKATKVLESYIKQNMKFFVAKVNLAEQAKTGYVFLRPIQFAFESPKFMLPIRLGMVNAKGPQDLLVYAITKKGRVESTNYRTVRIPSNVDIPLSIKPKFADFYRALFDGVHVKENKKVVFMEYAWNMGWCDPCAADPLKPSELRKIGVFWLEEEGASSSSVRPNAVIRPIPIGGGAVQAYITRLHIRYDHESFPEDLTFQETSDTENFQGRYVMHHPWTKGGDCEAAQSYKIQLKERRIKEAETVAQLTNWKMEDILKEEGLKSEDSPKTRKWYETIFK